MVGFGLETRTRIREGLMPKFKDLTGQKFGKLTVIALAKEKTPHGMLQWECSCDCGAKKTVRVGNLGRNTLSCGCAHYTQGRLTHRHRLAPRWRGMIKRCENPRDEHYPRYGGRGITVCKRWHHLPNFLADMEAPSSRGLPLTGSTTKRAIHRTIAGGPPRESRRSIDDARS